MTKRLILIVFILFSVITTAQERTSSPYSFYGIGMNKFRGTVENRSMGGLSIYADSIHVNLSNPAAYGRLRLTTYTVGVGNTSIKSESDTESGSNNTTSLDYLAIGIPTGKFGFGFGIIPYSAVGYDILDVNQEAGTVGRFSGKGGLNKVFLSAGYAINDNISVGVDLNYNFGNIQNKNIFIREGLQFGSREINRSDLSGFSYKIGLDYQRMLKEDLNFHFGAYFTPETTLSSENKRELATIVYSAEGKDITIDARDIESPNTDLTLPSSLTVGAGLGQPKKWFVGLEYTTAGAADFNNRSFSAEGATYDNSAKYTLGGYYIPDYNSLTSYFNRIVYRGGFRLQDTGLSINGEGINEFGISFGLGLPVGGMLSNINLGFEYGQRGTTNAGLIKENFFNGLISLSLNDRWFVKRKFE